MKHLLYGVRRTDVPQTARLIAEILGCNFQERESDYLGIYQIAKISAAQIKVVSQLDPEGDPLEDGFEEYGTLVYVDGESEIQQLDSLTGPQGPLERLRGDV